MITARKLWSLHRRIPHWHRAFAACRTVVVQVKLQCLESIGFWYSVCQTGIDKLHCYACECLAATSLVPWHHAGTTTKQWDDRSGYSCSGCYERGWLELCILELIGVSVTLPVFSWRKTPFSVLFQSIKLWCGATLLWVIVSPSLPLTVRWSNDNGPRSWWHQRDTVIVCFQRTSECVSGMTDLTWIPTSTWTTSCFGHFSFSSGNQFLSPILRAQLLPYLLMASLNCGFGLLRVCAQSCGFQLAVGEASGAAGTLLPQGMAPWCLAQRGRREFSEVTLLLVTLLEQHLFNLIKFDIFPWGAQ